MSGHVVKRNLLAIPLIFGPLVAFLLAAFVIKSELIEGIAFVVGALMSFAGLKVLNSSEGRSSS